MKLLRRIEPAKKMARFYVLDLEVGLFGHTVLVRRWGRSGTYGRRREHWFEDPVLAQTEMDRLAAAKARRGYLPVTDHGHACR